MNNVAQLGINIAVRNVKQVEKVINHINDRLNKLGKSVSQNSKQMERGGKTAEDTGRKQEKTFNDGIKKSNELTKSLDKVVKKWLSVGGAITLVSSIIRKAFNRIDEHLGIRRMATSAGAMEGRIYGLGKAIKKFGGDASSAAGAYTSLGDILGAARSGRGISQDVVTASSRYGIALNGGMLTEDQLMTNIAKAMQAQRKAGNMYGVRDIASAFGIDEAMMLHLSERGANWDRGLPGYNAKKAQEASQRAQAAQLKFEEAVGKIIDRLLPAFAAVLDGWSKLIDRVDAIISWFENKFGGDTKKKHDKEYKDAIARGLSPEQAKTWADIVTTGKTPTVGTVAMDAANAKVAQATEWAEHYNKTAGVDMTTALTRVRGMLDGVSGASANLVNNGGTLKIEIIDPGGVLRGKQIKASSNEFGTAAINNAGGVI